MSLDQIDTELFAARVAKFDARNDGPRVGDFVVMFDGEYRRFTHDWGCDIQTTCKGASFGASFYFGKCGHMDFSGGLDRALPKTSLFLTDEVKSGPVWFFHHDQARAHNGVQAMVDCRVFHYIP
jgi:hypothetical protein